MKNKGFTLVELLVVILIIGLISSIGVVSFGNIFGMAETSYYETVENDLLLSANDYFQDHRDELPLSDYREVFISDLVNGRYIEQVKDKNGNNCTGSIFVWRDEKGKYQYEVCLRCGNYVSGGRYCRGEGLNSIDVSAKTEKSNQNYNVLLRNPGIVNNENIIVTFEATNLGEKKVTKYVYVNTDNNHEGTCTSITNNKCTNVKITESGTYKVNAYDKDNKKIAQERYFYVFIDRNGLDFDIVGENKYIIEDESNTRKIEFKIQNVTQNIKKIEYRLDDGTYKEANGYSIIMDVNSKKGHILEVKITNLANEVVTKTFQFDVSYLINLDYKDGNVDFFEVIKGESYGYVSELPSQYTGRTAKWLYNNLEVTNDTIVTLDKRHTLELKNYEVIDGDNLSSNCISGLIYNGEEQKLTIDENEYITFANNKGINAGTYEVVASLKDGAVWSKGGRDNKKFNCEIAKKSVTVIASDQNKDYDGIALTADNTCTISNGLTGDIVECSNNTGSQTNAGTSAKVVGTAIIKNNGVDVTANYDITPVEGNLTVNKVNATCPSVTSFNGSYDGNEKTIIVSGGQGGTIEYRTSVSDSWSTAIPTRTSIGTTTVYIRVNGDDNHNTIECGNSSITINNVALICPSSPSDKTFSGSSQNSGITCPTGSTAGGTTSATDVGSYTQTCTANTGYSFAEECSVNWKINTKVLSCPTSPSNKEYTGSSQNSGITCPTGSTAGGTKKATNVGSYTQTCTANTGYSFADDCSVDWKITTTYTVQFKKNTAQMIGTSTDSTISMTCVDDGSSSCNEKTPSITAKDGYSIIGWGNDKKNPTSILSANEDFTINSTSVWYAITGFNAENIRSGDDCVLGEKDNYDPSSCLFRGKSPNNYIKFNGVSNKYRILNINSWGNKQFKIILPSINKTYYGKYDGFESMLNNDDGAYYKTLNSDSLSLITDTVFYTGKMSYMKESNKTISNAITQEKKSSVTKKAWIISPTEFLRASDSEMCNPGKKWSEFNREVSTNVFPCANSNTNWLYLGNYYIILSNRHKLTYGESKGEWRIRTIKATNNNSDQPGYLNMETVNIQGYYYPIHGLKTNVYIIDGSGTKTDPYIPYLK